MDTWEEDRLRRFQQLVDLDALPSPHSPEEGVVADWRAKLTPSMMEWTLHGWDLFFRHVRAESEPGGALGEWALRRRGEQLAVKIFVSSVGVQLARLYFRRLAMSSTAPEYPYRSTVSGEVVTFYVASPSLDRKTHNDSVLRLFRNVVFDVRVYDASISVLDVADDLLRFAREHANAQLLQHLPSVEQLKPPEVTPPEVQVQVPEAPDPLDEFHDTDFYVKVETGGQVDFQGFAERNAKFQWERHPEDGFIRVQVIDRRTLLSQTLLIPAQSIQPPGT